MTVRLHMGDEFRAAFARLGEVWSLIPPSVGVMALTATATRSLQHDPYPYACVSLHEWNKVSSSVVHQETVKITSGLSGDMVTTTGSIIPKFFTTSRCRDRVAVAVKAIRINNII